MTARPRRYYSEQRSQRGPGTVSMNWRWKEIAASGGPKNQMLTHRCQMTGIMRSGWLRLSRRSITHESPPSAARAQKAGRAARSKAWRSGRLSRARSPRAVESRRRSPGRGAPGAGLRGGRAVGLKRQMTHGRKGKATQRDRREVVPSGCLPAASSQSTGFSLHDSSSSHPDGQRGTGRWRPQPPAASASHPSTWTQMQRGRCSIQESRAQVRTGASHRRDDGDSPQGSYPHRKWSSGSLSRAGGGEW